jgi:N-sulfoglucosamine sulfohydrolase
MRRFERVSVAAQSLPTDVVSNSALHVVAEVSRPDVPYSVAMSESSRITAAMLSRAFFPRVVLALALLAAAASRASAQAEAKTGDTKRPNILWIIGEDMGPDLGVYGTPEVRTPNLDAFAAQGMRFNHCFTTGAGCSPSRSAFNTGRYQTTLGAHNQCSHRPDEPGYQPHPLPPGVRILSDWLRDAGYLTGDIVELPKEIGFRGSAHTDWNFTYPGKPFDTNRWIDLKMQQPFYAQVNLPEAHRGKNWDEAHTKLKQLADPAKVRLPPYYPDHPVVRQDWRIT